MKIMTSLPFRRLGAPSALWQRHGLPVVLLPSITLVCLVLAFWPSLCEPFQFDRTAFFSGQWWRLFTGHLVHWNREHLLWDLGVFMPLSVLCLRRGPVRWCVCLLAAAVLIPLSVLIWLPAMQGYRGLSGLDTALFALLAAILWRDGWSNREWLRLIVIGGLFSSLAVKTAVELFTGETLFVNCVAAGFTPVPLAHVVGALTGAAIGLIPSDDLDALGVSEAAGARSGFWAGISVKERGGPTYRIELIGQPAEKR